MFKPYSLHTDSMKKELDSGWIDISTTLSQELVVWPGDPKIEIKKISTVSSDGYNLTTLSLSAHSGTHLDAPLHYFENGLAIDEIALERLMGRVIVIETDVPVIKGDVLDSYQIRDNDKIFFKTKNSDVEWTMLPFLEDYVYLDESAADHLIEQGVSMVGIDYLSIAHPHQGETVHKMLLGSEILILEGLLLSGVPGGIYEMICMPLKIKGADGGPVRVLLRGII